MEREVKWFDLFPKAIEFLGEIVGSHIVFGAPHGPVVLKAELAGSLVGELDVAHEVLANGFGGGVPAGPGILKCVGIAAFGEDFAELFEIFAACRAAGAILALTVSALHAAHDACQLLALRGIGGGGDGEGELEQFELACGHGVEFETVEARGLLGVGHGGGDGFFVEFGGDCLGIVGNVGGLDPVGAGGVYSQEEEFLFGVVDEFARLFGSCLGVGGECHRGEGARGARYCTNLHASTLARLAGFPRRDLACVHRAC